MEVPDLNRLRRVLDLREEAHSALLSGKAKTNSL
jgi:hypothetical protein